MGVPLGDGGEKKFNWASELSTLKNHLKRFVLGGFLLLVVRSVLIANCL